MTASVIHFTNGRKIYVTYVELLHTLEAHEVLLPFLGSALLGRALGFDHGLSGLSDHGVKYGNIRQGLRRIIVLE